MRFHLALLAAFACVLPFHAQSAPNPVEDTSISVRALRRLAFEILPPYSSPSTVVFRLDRRGNTNERHVVHFEIAGSARLDTDYVRANVGSEPGTISTGHVQTVVFEPGQDRAFVIFDLIPDAEEISRYIRLEVVPPPEGEPPYRLRRRHCATVWIVPATCRRPIATPGGGYTCLRTAIEPLKIPKALLTTARRTF